jgi:hypothetical protein
MRVTLLGRVNIEGAVEPMQQLNSISKERDLRENLREFRSMKYIRVVRLLRVGRIVLEWMLPNPKRDFRFD